jgi:hypothetical protein
MKSKKYLIHLSGGGDETYFVVGEATFNYINSPRPPELKSVSGVKETIPQAVIDEMIPEYVKMIENPITVTSGSCENDRALFVMFGFKQHDYLVWSNKRYESMFEGYLY